MKQFALKYKYQAGASLIEVLVAVLILSFGVLSMGAMLSFSVQMPKLSGYRSTATNIASDHIERIRANPSAFVAGSYASSLSYNATFNTISASHVCNYPTCTPTSMAAMDVEASQIAARALLPAGGMIMKCDPAGCGAVDAVGNLWIVWQEPKTTQILTFGNTDYCPPEVTGTYTGVRCLYVRFKL